MALQVPAGQVAPQQKPDHGQGDLGYNGEPLRSSGHQPTQQGRAEDHAGDDQQCHPGKRRAPAHQFRCQADQKHEAQQEDHLGQLGHGFLESCMLT
ncbi:MAG: hypothetical protein U5L11_17135 [Arhodomonas sp.]|nr:hypothetical protein [Arhodomonas sp.]